MNMYFILLGLLMILSVFDLVVGVSNDATNFLNSAVGCRAAKRRTLLAVAGAGVMIGTAFSGGMMEIARSGIFVPSQFYFTNLMVMFLAVVLSDVILLNTFNRLGLPTSTTVSMVFELFGAAIAGGIYTMHTHGDAPQEIAAYLNSSKALTIISGIFVSVLVAFTCGCVVMWLARLIFSFRYEKVYRVLGPLWCGGSLTTITYFIIFKGLRYSTIITPELASRLQENLTVLLLGSLLIWTFLAAVLQYLCHVNTLKVTVLAGTGALALAFAGNDLVNFIGVFMAAKSSYALASDTVAAGGNLATLKMGALGAPVQAELFWLLGSGVVMVLALFFSRQARNVTETSVKLARAGSVGREKFGSCATARVLVRSTMTLVQAVQSICPRPIARFVGKRFTPLTEAETDGADFDLVRGSVTLTLAALLISIATSLKLPLSTTYVTFMVAMGSSLADRAWGRDSAVYRITGVLTVVGGWLFTGLAASTAAFLAAAVMLWGGAVGIVVMLGLGLTVLLCSILSGNKKKKSTEEEVLDLSKADTMRRLGESAALFLGRELGLYSAVVNALVTENRPALKTLRKRAKELNRSMKTRRDEVVIPTLRELNESVSEQGQLLYRLQESCSSIAESMLLIVKAGYNHLDNNHSGLSTEQASDLLTMTEKLAVLFPDIIRVLRNGDSENNLAAIEAHLARAGELRNEFGNLISRHIIREAGDENSIRTSVLYLNLLNETRVLLSESYNLLSDQRELLKFSKA